MLTMLCQAEMTANIPSEQHFPSTIIASCTFIKVHSTEGCLMKKESVILLLLHKNLQELLIDV